MRLLSTNSMRFLSVSLALMLFGGLHSVVRAQAKPTTLPQKKEEGKTEAKPKTEAKKVAIGGIEWYSDYDEAAKIAQEEEKLMWLHFGENPG